MTELSPAAKAVSYVYDNAPEKETGNHRYYWLAAALREAADQAEDVWPPQPYTEWGEGWLNGVRDVAAGLRRIANELEAQ